MIRKNKNIFTVLCMIGCFMLGGSHGFAQKTGGNKMKAFAQDNNAFVCDLYAQLRQQEGNLFFSPYSISTALAMTYAGARSDTAAQMEKVLHFNLKEEALHSAFSQLSKYLHGLEKDGDIALKLANALWIQKKLGLLKKFKRLNEQYYKSEPFQVDFKNALEKARREINAWVADKTNHKIEELLQKGDIDPLTLLVLTNAIYFKGNWQNPFDEKMTRAESFWVTPDRDVKVPTMSQKGNFWHVEDKTLQIVALPYGGETLAMVILLPRAHDGLAEIESRLDAETIAHWLSEMYQRTLMLSLPKFTFSSRFDLSKTLETMGMKNAFSGSADFSGIAPEHLFITKVIHEAFVEVNEQGTEATAATATMMGRSMPQQFIVDHPFIFFIQDMSTGSILFMGRVINPAK